MTHFLAKLLGAMLVLIALLALGTQLNLLGTGGTGFAVLEGMGSGLVGYWNFDEGTGTTASDYSGSGNHATTAGGPNWAAGKFGNGFSFSGTSNSFSIPYSKVFDFGPDDFTVSLWFKTTSTAANSFLFSKDVPALSNNGIFVMLNSGVEGRATGWVYNERVDSYKTGLNDGQWHHVVLEHSAGNMALYIDGTLEKSAYFPAASAGVTISALGMGGKFTGSLDDVRVYNRALSASEVQQLYTQIPPTYSQVPPTNPILVQTKPGGSVYIANTSQGNDTGASCADAHSIAWLNTQSNWATVATAGKISPGGKIHLCGTISSPMVFQGSGEAGNPITLFFEPGAKMSAPYWPPVTWLRAAIYVGEKHHIIIDGGTKSDGSPNGAIESTQSGTDYPDKYEQNGVLFYGCSDCEVKNMAITGMYKRTPLSGDISGSGIGINASGNNVSIHDNVLIDCSNCIDITFAGGFKTTGLKIYNNKISRMSVGIDIGQSSQNAWLDDVNIYNNDISDAFVWAGWDTSQTHPWLDHYHNNGMHIFANNEGSKITNMKIHGNKIHGKWGLPGNATSWLFLELNANSTGTEVYNNLLAVSDNAPPANPFISAGGSGTKVYNNTVVSNGSGFCMGPAAEIYNNICYGTSWGILYGFQTPDFSLYLSTLKSGVLASNNNIYYNFPTSANPSGEFRMGYFYINPGLKAWQDATALDKDSKYLDPRFVDLANGDYRLRSDSPAIDAGAGAVSAIVATDITGAPRPQGSAWDIGAYEYYSGQPIVPPPVVQNLPPLVSIISPENGDAFSSPSSVLVIATASDGDGAVAKVEIFSGASIIATATQPPYTATIGGPSAGTYTFTARATDDKGAATTSAPIVITITQDTTPPTISNGQPTGTLPSDIAQATLSVNTDENASCRYTTIANTPFISMALALTPNQIGTTHTTTIIGLQEGRTYSYYVRCKDSTNNTNNTDYTITFSTASPPTPTTADTDSDGVPDSIDKCPTETNTPVQTNAYGCPLPIATKFNIKPDFENMDLNNVTNFEIGISNFGKITYTNTHITLAKVVNGTYTPANLDQDINITRGLITVNADNVPELNQPVAITLYNIKVTNPKIKRNGIICTECQIISNTNNTLVFTVPGF